MKSDYKTFKIWKSSLKKLRLLAVLSENSMVQIVDELVTEKLEEVQIS